MAEKPLDTLDEVIAKLIKDVALAWPDVTIAFDATKKQVSYTFVTTINAVAFTAWLDDWYRALSASMPVVKEAKRATGQAAYDLEFSDNDSNRSA